MKKFIKQKLHEAWGWDEETKSPLRMELEKILTTPREHWSELLSRVEANYETKYAEFDGDTYGVIDAIDKEIPEQLKPTYDEMHPKVMVKEDSYDEELKFNDGRFNKDGANTIYMGDNPIVDFGVGGLGDIKINGETIPNALFLKGGYNASEQGKGYGQMGLKFIFQKLPKIQNIVLQCYDTACPFWVHMGGQEVSAKEMAGGNMLRTLRISRDSFE